MCHEAKSIKHHICPRPIFFWVYLVNLQSIILNCFRVLVRIKFYAFIDIRFYYQTVKEIYFCVNKVEYSACPF